MQRSAIAAAAVGAAAQACTHHAEAQHVDKGGQPGGVGGPGGRSDLVTGRGRGARQGSVHHEQAVMGRARPSPAEHTARRQSKQAAGEEQLTRLPSTHTLSTAMSRKWPPAAETSGPQAGYALHARPATPPAQGRARGSTQGETQGEKCGCSSMSKHRGKQQQMRGGRGSAVHAETAGLPAAASSWAPWQMAAMGFLAGGGGGRG